VCLLAREILLHESPLIDFTSNTVREALKLIKPFLMVLDAIQRLFRARGWRRLLWTNWWLRSPHTEEVRVLWEVMI
jgi:hypothetical protein